MSDLEEYDGFDAQDFHKGRRPTAYERLTREVCDVLAPRDDALSASTEAASKNLYEFTRQAWHILEPGRPLVEGWVIECVCEHLEAIYKIEIRNLLICQPPGTMKSILSSVMWLCWCWLHNPGLRWIFASYGQGLSHRDSDRTRDVLKSSWYQERWGHVFQIKRASDTKERFSNDRQGYRIATTIGGKAMGERADILCYDDPQKASEAGSEARRAEVIKSWTQTMSGRAADARTVRKLVVMQRLHERDLCGHLLAEVGGYEHLVLPMYYEPKRYSLPGWDGVGPPHKDLIPVDADPTSQSALSRWPWRIWSA